MQKVVGSNPIIRSTTILALHRRARLVGPGPGHRGRDLGFDDAQEFSDLASIVQGVAQRKLAVDGVVVASSYPRLCHVSGRLELAEDLHGGALGDPDEVGDVADPQFRVAGKARKHLEVDGQKRPPRLTASRLSVHGEALSSSIHTFDFVYSISRISILLEGQ